ncbi:MAG: biotin--[Agathobacter sp.]|nr:biotin--[acetyl-CoA-carboxylase] ligase [Agathobacter sp.]
MITKRYHFDIVDSTNRKAKEFAQQGCESGTLITATEQNAGVGRRGRSWSSEKGTGIYMSMVLRPEIEIEHLSQLTLLAAMAVAKAFQKHGIVEENTPCIKWPNDIALNKKKVCGILTELALQGTKMDYVIVGIGINVSNQKFPEEIASMASSILLETGLVVDKEQLITDIWDAFAVYFKTFLQTQDFAVLKEEYEEYLLNRNQGVKVLDPAGEYEGVAVGITNKGELIVNTGTEERQVSSGEVSVRGIYGYV